MLIFQEADSTSSSRSPPVARLVSLHGAFLPSRLLLRRAGQEQTLSDVIVERDLVRLRFVPTPAIDALHWRQQDIRRRLTTPPLPLRSTAAVATYLYIATIA